MTGLMVYLGLVFAGLFIRGGLKQIAAAIRETGGRDD